MKKGVDFVWDAECEVAFQDIKSYLTKPPVLVAPTTGKPFILYTRALTILWELYLHKKMMEEKKLLYTTSVACW